MSDSELYHKWLRKGETAENHKYIRRWWANGHWNYQYSDGTVTERYPKGQNYKTVSQVKAEKAAVQKAKSEQKAKAATKQKKIEDIDKRIDTTIRKGREVIDRLDMFMHSRVVDLFK